MFDDLASLQDAGSANGSETSNVMHRTLKCLGCENSVRWPCWYCAECDDNVFICMTCDTKGGITKDQHLDTHTLVRCQARLAEEARTSTEQRIEALETRLGSMHDSFTVIAGWRELKHSYPVSRSCWRMTLHDLLDHEKASRASVESKCLCISRNI